MVYGGVGCGLNMTSILIVDDEAEIVDQVKEYFEEEGFRVFVAETGFEGIELVKREHPTILILDMKLPDVPGLTVLKVAKDESPQTKIIAITGFVDQAMMDQAEVLGRDTFLQKPFDLEKLKDEVDRLLKTK